MKRIRQDKRRRARNRSVKSAVKTAVKKAEAAAGGDQASARLSEAVSAIDRAAKKNIVHWRTAARKKSRLARRVRRESEAKA
jgi:small subunit ribosomal protein S20